MEKCMVYGINLQKVAKSDSNNLQKVAKSY